MEREIKTASFVNRNYELRQEQKAMEISENLGKKIKESKKKIHRRQFMITASCVALLTAGTTFGLVKSQQPTPIHNIIREAEIHTNHGLTPDGKFINPNLDHDCVIENSKIEDYAKQQGFNEAQIEEIMKAYHALEENEIVNQEFEEKIEGISKK